MRITERLKWIRQAAFDGDVNWFSQLTDGSSVTIVRTTRSTQAATGNWAIGHTFRYSRFAVIHNGTRAVENLKSFNAAKAFANSLYETTER